MRLDSRGSRGRLPALPVIAVLLAAAVSACSRDERVPASASASAEPPATAAPPAENSAAPASSGALPAASGTPRAVDGARAPVAAPSAKPSAPLATTADGGAVACGEKGQPDCPLQAWMKKHANPPLRDKDAAALATAFDRMVPLAPPGGAYPNWASIAKDAASAARAGEIDAARAGCRGCHDQYKAKYRTEHRTRPI